MRFDGGPAGFDPFRAKERSFARYRFGPSIDPFAMDGDEKDLTAVGTAEARLKKVDEWHPDFAQSNSFDFHWKTNQTQN
jgi:hypothetical protein